MERHSRRRHCPSRIGRIYPRRYRTRFLVRTRGPLFHRNLQSRRVRPAPIPLALISSLLAKQTSRSNKHPPPPQPSHRPPSSHLSTGLSDPNNPTTHCTHTKELWSSSPTQASPVKSPSVQIKCSCAVLNCGIPPGYMASSYSPDTKPSSCGTRRE